MITMSEISFRYRKKQIYNNFSLSIEKGKVYGLLGKNGAGKSTLLYLMSGLLTPQKGNVTFKDVDVTKRKPSIQSDMFIVPEEFELPNISLKKYVALNSPFYPNFSYEQLKKGLECFEMNEDVSLDELSMGEKKKVFMSFALATNTSLLILDEPTNGLDIPGKSQFRKFIALNMTDDKTIIISTHQVKDVDNMLEQIIIVDENKVLLNDSAAHICEKLRFIESYKEVYITKAIYSAPSVQGYNLIIPNEEKEDTALNLESLFNAMLSMTDKMNTYLK
ncbi:MAG: ABC transporter ATP-binding protein [Dysgonomonas sp.]|nr:ABC transporter ATP-binding protein [Dysgonomonas sp.]